MKNRYRYTIICVLFITSMLFCGAGSGSIVTLDPEQHIMYENIKADVILEDFATDKAGASEAYDNRYCAIWGNVAEISGNGKSFVITALSGKSDGTIQCKTSDTEIVETVKTLNKGQTVRVYGETSVSFIKKDISINIDRVEVIENGIYSDNQYSTIGGRNYDTDDMSAVELKDGKVCYHIPQEWKSVEKPLENTRLDGYQYCLNEINQVTAKAESLFVFYFDNEKCLKNPNDKTKTKEIQVAIINNILKNDPGTGIEFTRTNSQTYYGASYNYYCDTYTNSENYETYRVEFVFENVGNDGVMVYLYVVNIENENRHIDDVMMVMKTVEM